MKIFELRPRKFFKLNFLGNAWAENFFGLQIRIQRKISRRMVCVYIGSIFVSPTFPLNTMFNAHAITMFVRIVGKITKDPI